MRKDAVSRTIAIGAVLVLVAAPAALAEKPADPGSNGGGHGHGQAKGHASEHGKAGKPVVMYVFKGTYSGDSSVAVTQGNAHVNKADLVGTTMSFDLTGAKIVVDDNTGDGNRDLSDVNTGDQVVVKARLPKSDPGSQPFKAKQLVDQTHAAGTT